MGERFGDYEMELLSKTTDLKEVDICGCGDVTERGLDFVISNCQKLEKLSISFCCQITGLSLDKLSHNFKQLSLNGNELTPVIYHIFYSSYFFIHYIFYSLYFLFIILFIHYIFYSLYIVNLYFSF